MENIQSNGSFRAMSSFSKPEAELPSPPSTSTGSPPLKRAVPITKGNHPIDSRPLVPEDDPFNDRIEPPANSAGSGPPTAPLLSTSVDTLSTTRPITPENPPIQPFDHGSPDQATLRIYQEFLGRLGRKTERTMDDLFEWLDDLEKMLGSDAAVDGFFEWQRQQRTITDEIPDPSLFFAFVSQANWKTRNDALLSVNILLYCYTGIGIQELGVKLHGYELGLQIRGGVLAPRRASSELLRAYHVGLVEPYWFFGMRYVSEDGGNSSESGTGSMLFVALGTSLASVARPLTNN